MQLTRLFTKEAKWSCLFLMVLSYFTVVHNFWSPPALFWDENYHIASAQKYLNGVFFMEPHPPMGKLLIALGEKLTNMNPADDQFIGTDYATNPPAGFSFLGYRLFPVLLAWLTVPLIFGIFLVITRNPLWSTLLSFLYVFDNALLVHVRSAMLESTMLFFGALGILGFLLALEWRDHPRRIAKAGILFGLGFGGILTTKAFGLIFVLFIPALWLLLVNRAEFRAFFWKNGRIANPMGKALIVVGAIVYALYHWQSKLLIPGLSPLVYPYLEIPGIALVVAGIWKSTRATGSRGESYARWLIPAFVSFIVVYVGVWQIHYSLASRVNPVLPDKGVYQASPEYQNLITTGRNRSLLFWPIMHRDSINFVGHYERGVPTLDLCKADENGSPWFFWPLGGRTINYRWETPDGFSYRYLYLVPNPVVWVIGFAGVVLAVVLLLGSLFFHSEETKLRHRGLLLVFLGMYVAYMGAVSTIDRVMYLYHYFLPLVFSFIIFGIVFMELQQIGAWKLLEQRKTAILLVLGTLIFLGFELFRPLTYYEPLSDDQFKLRQWTRLWELRCVHCDRESLLVSPRN
jgi:dolichyl-phosphate-mannose--protein O-mannosyl transferase